MVCMEGIYAFLNSKPGFFNDIEYGIANLTGESQYVKFKKGHTSAPKSVFLTYTESNNSIAGEPKELKAYGLYSEKFGVGVSSFDGKERGFSWIAIW